MCVGGLGGVCEGGCDEQVKYWSGEALGGWGVGDDGVLPDSGEKLVYSVQSQEGNMEFASNKSVSVSVRAN